MGMMKRWVFTFGWHGPDCPIISARVLAETETAAWYLLMADPRLEKVGVKLQGGSRYKTQERTKCTYAGDMLFFKPAVEEIVMRSPQT